MKATRKDIDVLEHIVNANHFKGSLIAVFFLS